MKRLFRLASVAAAIAVLVHVAALTVPAVNLFLYNAGYPWWRHVVFIGIDALALLLLRRPAWLVWPYAVLTAQVVAASVEAGIPSWLP